MKKFKLLQEKEELILNKFIVGIDPSKKKHQAMIIRHYREQGYCFILIHFKYIYTKI
jgi:ABC-type Mn2+/Zn2+ transport system ATPase subunit